MYVGLKVLHAACIILYTCKSSLYFILVFFFGSSLKRASWKISFFFLLNVLPSENKDYYYYYYYYYNYYQDLHCVLVMLNWEAAGQLNKIGRECSTSNIHHEKGYFLFLACCTVKPFFRGHSKQRP